MTKNYLIKSYPLEWEKVKDLVYHSKINNKIKGILMKDEEFIYDALNTVQLWEMKQKRFSLKKAMDEIIEQYVRQIPLITAKSLGG